jgi:molecular chaperone GrpE
MSHVDPRNDAINPQDEHKLDNYDASDQEDDVSYEQEDQDIHEALKKLKHKLKKCDAEKNEYLQGWQRAKADSINASKTAREELMRVQIRVEEQVIIDLLPVLDSFGMAMNNKEVWEKGDPQWRMGVEYIYSQFKKILSDYGVSEIPVKRGDRLNLDIHQPLSTCETDSLEDEDLISKIIQEGYKGKNGVLRPVSVEVYKYKSH